MHTSRIQPGDIDRNLFTPEEPIRRWEQTRRQFLDVVDPEQRILVGKLLEQLQQGASGLRDWVTAIAWRGANFPKFVPPEVINVYLRDEQALALHQCQDCGLAVPVRPNSQLGPDAEPEQIYFPRCPLCGGATSWKPYVSKPYGALPARGDYVRPR